MANYLLFNANYHQACISMRKECHKNDMLWSCVHTFFFFSESNHLLSVVTNEEREPGTACGSLEKDHCSQCCSPGHTTYVAEPLQALQVENLSTLGQHYRVPIEYKWRYLKKIQKLIYSHIRESHKPGP